MKFNLRPHAPQTCAQRNIRNQMKTTLATVILALSFLVSSGQVTIKPAPKKGFEVRIRQAIDTMKVVDTHEHLVSFEGIRKSKSLDFMWLFHHYADDDIKSAGMSKPQFNTLLTDSLTVAEKWKIMKPYYEGSFNTGYNRVTALTVDRLFGIKEFNEQSLQVLSDKLKTAYQTDWYKTILQDKCRIDFLINDGQPATGDPAYFRYTKRFGYFQLDSKEKIDQLAKQQGTTINTLEDLVNTLNQEFEKAVKNGLTVIKNSTAYFRSQYYEDVSKKKAGEVFLQVMESKTTPLSPEAAKPLADYMMHRILDLALKYNKPIQIHTGLQAGDGNFIQNSNPALLANLFLKYRNVKFILFHGGYPYGGELASLGKNFRNVYIDLCWLYVISPSYSQRYLHEWLETIPANKIMAFGGDYENVENIYGHLLFAKEIVGNVLIEKVKNRYFSEEEAIKVAQMMLHDNAVILFQLKH